MLRSMTGFGAARARVASEEITAELRSVNGKFCEVKARLPRELLALEADAVRTVKARLARGAVELTVRRGDGASGPLAPRVDEELAARYAERFRALQARLGLAGEVTIADVLAAEGVVGLAEREPDLAAAAKALEEALSRALDALVAMREREGEALRKDILARADVLDALGKKLASQAPEALAQHRDKLARRVQELAGSAGVDPVRIAQEIALLAERSDISEELTRLESHLAQLRSMCAGDEPCGRRLDFLTQELNREVNTAGSKSPWSEASTIVVEMKAELERVREQVQNVE